MNKSLRIYSFALFIIFSSITFCYAQEYPRIALEPGTTKSGVLSTYHQMVPWDSSPYKEFTYSKRSGPNPWEVTEYLNFRMLFPEDYNAIDSDEKYPLVILLHGAGESGIKWTNRFDYVNGYGNTPPAPEKIDNNDHQLLFGGREFISAQKKDKTDPRHYPGFVVFPQVPYNGSWAGAFDGSLTQYNRQVIELVDLLISQYQIDPNRIYMLGLSNGARGAWDLINRRPDLFAASIVFSGVGDRQLMSGRLAHFPLWIFQGGLDDNPTPAAALQMLDGLESEGGSPRYTLYEDLGHGVWTRAFTEPDFYSWLLSNNKQKIHVYHGKTHFETLNDIDVKLGISPGFTNYEWKYNGEVLKNTDSPDFEPEMPGSYQVRFFRNGTWSSWSEPIIITSDETETQAEYFALYRINVGASSVVDEPVEWSADNDVKPSQYWIESPHQEIFKSTKPLNNFTGAPDEIFLSGRRNFGGEIPLKYSLPVSGRVKVTLYFYEQHDSDGDQSLIRVNIEDKTIDDEFNLYAEAGNDALKKTYELDVKDGKLDISLKGASGEPILSGLEVQKSQFVTGGINRNEKFVVISPNPFSENLSIKIGDNSIALTKITIRNINGDVVYLSEINKKEKEVFLNTSSLNILPGLYFLELTLSNNKLSYHKVIKY